LEKLEFEFEVKLSESEFDLETPVPFREVAEARKEELLEGRKEGRT